MPLEISFFNTAPEVKRFEIFLLIPWYTFWNLLLFAVYETDDGGQSAKKRRHVESEDDGNDQVTENANTRYKGTLTALFTSTVWLTLRATV